MQANPKAMDADGHRLVEAIHQSGSRCVLAVTGGGVSTAGLLLSMPGGSRSVLEVIVPYHEQALVEFLGRRPEHFCSASASFAMATRALERARWLAPAEMIAGIGCTASLATDRPKHGEHRCHVTTRSGDRASHWSLTLHKGARDRKGEEAVVTAILLNAMADACGVVEQLPVLLLPGEEVQVETTTRDGALATFLRGDVAAVCAGVDGRLRLDAPRPALLLPGAFNPVHEGHRWMAAVAARLTGGEAAYELSVVNVDKPPLTDEEVRRRLAQFAWHAPVWLTRAPTFVEKAALFPGVTFVVGADTAARIVAPRYYQDSEEQMLLALAKLRECRCRFLVAGRLDRDGRFLTLAEVAMPAEFRELFAAIPADVFRLDVSSTLLRG